MTNVYYYQESYCECPWVPRYTLQLVEFCFMLYWLKVHQSTRFLTRFPNEGEDNGALVLFTFPICMCSILSCLLEYAFAYAYMSVHTHICRFCVSCRSQYVSKTFGLGLWSALPRVQPSKGDSQSRGQRDCGGTSFIWKMIILLTALYVVEFEGEIRRDPYGLVQYGC